MPPVPPAPVPNPDLKAPKDGNFLLTLISSSGARATLVLNGKELWPMSSMEPNAPKSIGYFENGDGLRFELKIDAEFIHNIQIFPTGWRVWQLKRGIKTATCNDFKFVFLNSY